MNNDGMDIDGIDGIDCIDGIDDDVGIMIFE
jgi:hypothetical protein